MTVGPGYQHWTRGRIIICIRAFIAMNGQSPRCQDFKRDGWPSPQTVKHHCGSWGSALRAANQPDPGVGKAQERRVI